MFDFPVAVPRVVDHLGAVDRYDDPDNLPRYVTSTMMCDDYCNGYRDNTITISPQLYSSRGGCVFLFFQNFARSSTTLPIMHTGRLSIWAGV